MREVEAGTTQGDVARRLGVSQQTVYRWKERFGGMDVSEARRLRHLEDENARLKKLLAAVMLDKEVLQTALAKKR